LKEQITLKNTELQNLEEEMGSLKIENGESADQDVTRNI